MEQTSPPLVSVVIPSYNKANLTVKTIQSVLDQTYSNVEIIVVDDGSVDDSKEKINSFGNKITAIYKENRGACSARNVGIEKASGKYIALVDCDDLYLPTKIEKSVKFLEDNQDYVMVHTDAFFIDESDNIIRKYAMAKAKKFTGLIKNELVVVDFICNPTVMIKKDTLQSLGGYDESMFYPADWDMWLRISEKGPIGYIDEPLSKYRVTSGENLKNYKKLEKESEVVLKNFFDRNQDVSSKVKKKAYGRFYLSTSFYYIAVNEDNNARKLIYQAWCLDPLKIKTLVFLIAFMIAPSIVRKKINKHYFFKD